MPIHVRCGGCGAKLAVQETSAGKTVNCPKCAAPVAVPAGDDGFRVIEDAATPAAGSKCIYCGKLRPAGIQGCPHCGRGVKGTAVPLAPIGSAAAALRRVELLDPEVEVRERPSTEAAVVLRLRKGSRFFILEDGDLWLKARSVTGKEGYVPSGTKVREVRVVPGDDADEALEVYGGDDVFALEKVGIRKGVLGGIIMMVIAAVWFGLGWMAGTIFIYPPILFCIGLFALIRGLATGNVAGDESDN